MSLVNTCSACANPFTVSDADLAFYQRVSPRIGNKIFSVPPPTLCPDCRKQNRVLFRNERSLYNRKCSVCRKDMISMYSPDKELNVYCLQCYFDTDRWDPLASGVDMDFSQPFSVSLQNVFRKVPLAALFISGHNENSDYTNCAGYNKNTYLSFNSGYNEDCSYSRGLGYSKNCMDIYCGNHNEYCYECVNCTGSYALFFSQNCNQCSESAFLYNCSACSNCFGCTNLYRKQYYIFNQPYTKKEYQEIMGKLGSYASLQAAREKFTELVRSSLHRSTQNVNVEGSTGDYLTNTKNCLDCFEVNESEDCRFLDSSKKAKDGYDMFGHGYFSELFYQTVGTGHGNSVIGGLNVDKCSNTYYSIDCSSSQNLFGCVGVRNKQYCILNKQYTKQEYETLVARIIEHMTAGGEWGNFFQSHFSPFGYNETLAQEYYPLTREVVTEKGFAWSDYQPPKPDVTKVIPAAKLPDDIRQIPDEILQWAIECEITHKPFRITKSELAFYRQHNLPVPRRHPDQRHKDRVALKNPSKLWQKQCPQCQKEMSTTYAPDRPEKVYCEDCYVKEVY